MTLTKPVRNGREVGGGRRVPGDHVTPSAGGERAHDDAVASSQRNQPVVTGWFLGVNVLELFLRHEEGAGRDRPGRIRIVESAAAAPNARLPAKNTEPGITTGIDSRGSLVSRAPR